MWLVKCGMVFFWLPVFIYLFIYLMSEDISMRMHFIYSKSLDIIPKQENWPCYISKYKVAQKA